MDYSMLRFRRSLQALAAPADIQLQLIPDFLWGVDELAIEFDQWYQVIKRRRTMFSKRQRSILEDLNKKLDEISGPENLRYWMEDTVRNDIAWEDIRLLAKNALDAMGWPLENPLKKRSEIPGTISYGE
ncbi:MAG: hypothetical protein ACXACF_03610 [Candidatus Hermodarchaeia archaeon]|jgi:hypothetical protein